MNDWSRSYRITRQINQNNKMRYLARALYNVRIKFEYCAIENCARFEISKKKKTSVCFLKRRLD